jgi:hypothetical protein
MTAAPWILTTICSTFPDGCGLTGEKIVESSPFSRVVFVDKKKLRAQFNRGYKRNKQPSFERRLLFSDLTH